MEIITLILFILTTVCFFLMLMNKGNRNLSFSGAIFGVCALASALIEPWGDYSLILVLVLCLMSFWLMGGVLVGDNSE